MSELTGNRRYRKAASVMQMVGEAVILQVEYTSFAVGREDQPGRWVCQWRDATTDDLRASGGYYE